MDQPELQVILESVGILDDETGTISTPPWADAQTSADLQKVRAAGEGQRVEFMAVFPDHAHELAKELAAFGTSGGGAVYIGIADNGDLIDIDAPDAAARDAVAVRAQNIARGSVNPGLRRVEVTFAVEGAATVLVIRIPPQDRAVFYSNQRPYIRDDRVSRPATPDEVEECVWAHPSSEHRRELERLKLEFAKDMQESSRRHGELMHELRSRGTRGQ